MSYFLSEVLRFRQPIPCIFTNPFRLFPDRFYFAGSFRLFPETVPNRVAPQLDILYDWG